MSQDLSEGQRQEIEAHLRAGRKLEAIRRYRELTGAGLARSKQAVGLIEKAMSADAGRPADAPGLRSPIERPSARRNFIMPVALVLAAAVAVQGWLGDAVPGPQMLRELAETARQVLQSWREAPSREAAPSVRQDSPLTATEAVTPPPRVSIELASLRVLSAEHISAARSADEASGLRRRSDDPRPMPWHDSPLAEAIAHHYRRKLDNPQYQAWKSEPGLPGLHPLLEEEAAIKTARAELARTLAAPDGVVPIAIPRLEQRRPAVDGVFESGEWDGALALPMGVGGADTRLLMFSDGARLYLAVDAPQETSAGGYDQFRFYFHVNLAPVLRNERLHVSRGQQAVRALRATTARWSGRAPRNEDERWMRWNITDWGVLRRVEGASELGPHRRYEASLELDEAGLHRGVPFPVFVEVETDPIKRPDGSRERRMLGELGSQQAPYWFLIEAGGE